MATGVPTRKQSGNSQFSISISYPGKAEKAEILATPPADVVKVWNGDRQSPERGFQNRLYYGENLSLLAALLRDEQVTGKVRLIYIDPPFATQTAFHTRKLKHAYEDTLAGAEFLEFLRQRLILLYELLAEDGSIYVHLDEKMIFSVKIIMDEIFGANNYQNCITRKKCNPKNYTRKKYGNISDYIVFYTKSSQYVWNKPLEPWTEDRAREYQYVEENTGRRFMKVPLHAPGTRNGETGKPWRGMLPPPGKHWQYPPSKLDAMDARGEIYWSANGNPRRKVYLDENPGVSVQDIWLDFKDAHNQNIEITGYPTEKNPELLKRIIAASSNPGDLVLDCFAGSGTTLAVADLLGRSWIGIDKSSTAIQTTLQRFFKGTEPMGDFVSQGDNGKPARPSNNTEQGLPLFDFYQMNAAVASAPQPKHHHQPITDFALYSEVSLQEELHTIAAQWLSKLSDIEKIPEI